MNGSQCATLETGGITVVINRNTSSFREDGSSLNHKVDENGVIVLEWSYDIQFAFQPPSGFFVSSFQTELNCGLFRRFI